jgi:hypothetical protein
MSYIDPNTGKVVFGSPASNMGVSAFFPAAPVTTSSSTPELYQSPTDIYNTDMKKTVWDVANKNNLNLGDWSSLTDDQKSMFNPEQQNFIKNSMQDTPWYQNYGMISSFANLGSALGQLASLPAQYKVANAQTAALKQNMATAKEEQNRRNKNISAFNAFKG